MYTFTSGSLNDSSNRAGDPANILEAPNGVSFVTGVDGTPMSAVHLNGQQQYLRASANQLPSGAKSVSMWVNIDSIYGYPSPETVYGSADLSNTKIGSATSLGMYVMGFGAGGCGSSFILVLNNNDDGTVLELQGRCTALKLSVSPGPYYIEDFVGKWHHIAVTTSLSAGTSIYLDSHLMAHSYDAFCETNITGSGWLAVGTITSPTGTVPYYDNTATFFHGAIDNVIIFDVALSSEAVSNIYITQFTKSPTSAPTTASVMPSAIMSPTSVPPMTHMKSSSDTSTGSIPITFVVPLLVFGVILIAAIIIFYSKRVRPSINNDASISNSLFLS